MQDNTAKLFVSDEELEIFELTKIGFDQSMEDFLREKKAISLEFARQFNLNFTVSGDEIKPAIDYISDASGSRINRLRRRVSLAADFFAGVTLARYSLNIEASVQVTGW
jgi:hypothetical protein